MHWQLLQILQKFNLFHLKVALLLLVVFVAGLGAGVGALTLGWQGALGLPLVGFLGMALVVHGLVTLLLTQGLKAYGLGNHDLAVKLLWPAEIPLLRRYDKQGKAVEAFRDSRTQVAARVMRDMAQNFLGTLR